MQRLCCTRLVHTRTCLAVHMQISCAEPELRLLRCAVIRAWLRSDNSVQVSLDGAPPEPNPIKRMLQSFFRRTTRDPFYGIVAYRNFKRTDD
jgi:hypothetical protein